MTRIASVLNALVAAASAIGILCVLLMMLHVVADVIGRFVFNMPVEGTITIVSHYYMVILGFAPLAVAEAKDAHISVEVVSDLMPPGVQAGLASLASLVSVGAFSLLGIRTWIEAADKAESGAALQQGVVTIPIWPTYYALPLGCGLMVLVALWKFFCTLSRRPSGLAAATPEGETVNE